MLPTVPLPELRSVLNEIIKRFKARPHADHAPPPARLAPGLWGLERELAFPGGFRMPSRTTLVELPEGEVAVISAPPILGESCVEAIDGIGVVSHVIVPNTFHYVFAPAFLERYPHARLLVPRELRERVPSFDLGTDVADELPPAFRGVLSMKTLHAAPDVCEMSFFHQPTKTLVMVDLAFNITRFPRPLDRLAWFASGVPSGFGPGRTSRVMLLADRERAATYLSELRQWPFERIVFAHGDTVEHGARDAFDQAFGRYLPGG